jgi:hypothetical protein
MLRRKVPGTLESPRSGCEKSKGLKIRAITTLVARLNTRRGDGLGRAEALNNILTLSLNRIRVQGFGFEADGGVSTGFEVD